MIVRYLPLILVLAAIVLALAPLEAAAQTTLGPGVRTEMTPLDRAAHNGAFDDRRKPRADGRKPTVTPGDLAQTQTNSTQTNTAQSPPAAVNPADREPRPKTAGAPVNADADKKAIPPGSDLRQVRPAQAFPPERIQKTSPAPSRGGVDTPALTPKDDPRGVEERPDPGD